ncbi:hypothetical protein [Clostridium kluyveri]|uniref:Uncharacterized protein n=1 Tax=Clostridium kluyveri TaxID=1534 RepID=A0A1L5F305_CLOKL|nr:hypothetical protein [Clostridium kluyveri]APM37398.1 hypothetical protein BS101_00775 [Clostridium kluyveri]UZQ48547.1 hypothetical protein OP486_11045 [Clostridium kluyveri]
MKLKKKTAMVISFTVGIMMFTTTAMAEVASKSGYDQLKDSLKYTAENCTSTLSNFTIDASFVVKDNGNTIMSESSINKYDISKNSEESTNTSIKGSTKTESYSYRDKSGYITKSPNANENVYYLTEYSNEKDKNRSVLENPFKEDKAADIEKIADALVGSLKDSVTVTEKQDGTKEISGSLNNTQIPTLINAFTSFQFKSSYGNTNNSEDVIPKLTKNIFVNGIKGNMTTDKNGLIKTILASGTLNGADKTGAEHQVTLEVLVKIENINSTTVTKPDLSKEKVVKNIERDYTKLTNPQKYEGKYTSDIIVEDDDKFTKIGEAIVNIEKIDNKTITGSYSKEYLNGYENYANGNESVKFTGTLGENKDNFSGKFNGTTESNEKVSGDIYIQPNNASIYFNIGNYENPNVILDGTYRKVLD